MAIAIVLDFEGAPLDMYDQATKKMGLERHGKTPSGALFHWVAKTDTGIRVTDVWEDQDEFQKFSEEQIGPVTAELFPSPPQVTT